MEEKKAFIQAYSGVDLIAELEEQQKQLDAFRLVYAQQQRANEERKLIQESQRNIQLQQNTDDEDTMDEDADLQHNGYNGTQQTLIVHNESIRLQQYENITSNSVYDDDKQYNNSTQPTLYTAGSQTLVILDDNYNPSSHSLLLNNATNSNPASQQNNNNNTKNTKHTDEQKEDVVLKTFDDLNTDDENYESSITQLSQAKPMKDRKFSNDTKHNTNDQTLVIHNQTSPLSTPGFV